MEASFLGGNCHGENKLHEGAQDSLALLKKTINIIKHYLKIINMKKFFN